MCRHLAHLAPAPTTLSSVLTEPSHSLLVQSYAPADMRGGGTVNADGFGVAWRPVSTFRRYDDGKCSHVRYAHDRPMWTDASFLDLAGAVESCAIVAAVRSATVGMPMSTSACAPFVDRGTGLVFSHNGVVRGWPDSVAALAGTLPALSLLTLEAATDSALLWALLRARVAAGEDVPEACARLVADVLEAAPGSRLNLLVVHGDRVVATAVNHALAVRSHADGAVTVASEPLDDNPAWVPVPDGCLVIAEPGAAGSAPSVVVRPLRDPLGPSFPTVNAPDPRT